MAQSTAREDLNSIAPPKSPVTPEYLDAIRSVESNNQHIDPKTKRLLRSSAGAEGAYQIKPNTGRQPGFDVKPVRNNTETEHRRFAEDYLNAMWRRYGDKALMTVAYNQGPGTVDQALKDAKKSGTTWYNALKQDEGRDYLVKVMGTGAIPSLAQAQTQAQAQAPSVVAQAPEQDMSRPVTANPSIFRQGERMRDQRPLTSAPKVSLTPLQQFGVDNVGAGFQAALGFSMLGASGRGLPTEEQGIKEEEEADAEMAALEPTAKQASASLQSIPAFDAFSTQRQAPPVQMSEGGSLDDLGDDTGVVRYNPVVESTPTAPTPPKLNLRRQTASKAMSQIPAADGTSGKRSKESKEKEAAKGTARQQLQELQYKTGLTSLAIKDKLLGLGENTLGAPTFTRRGALERGPLAVTSFDEGGEAKKNPLGVAAKMLDTFNEYGKKAEEYGVKARDFLVANGISPTDIATGFMKLKSGVPFGLATYSGSLNEGEDEQFKKMMQQPKPVPVPSPKHFAWGGQAALGNYYNPTTKSYTNTPPMVANPNYTTQKYYERGTSGNYAESKDPFKAAGPVYGYTPAVAGTEEVPGSWNDDGYTPGTPGTPGTPESYAEILKPTENWNKQEIIDPSSGYVSTTGGVVPTNNSLPNWASPVARVEQPVIVPTNNPNISAPVVRDNPYANPTPANPTPANPTPANPNPWEPGGEIGIPEKDWNEQMYSPANFKKTKEYQDYVKSQEGGMQTQDMYDSPYFGSFGSGSYGGGLDKAYKDWAGSNIKPPAAPAPAPFNPANNAGINAPVVRDNPYAMPTDPVPRAEGSPETGETGAAYGNPAMLAAGEKMRARKAQEVTSGPLKDQVIGLMRKTEKAISKPLGLMEIRSYAMNRPKELGLEGEIGGEADAMRHLLLAREMRTKFPNTAAGMLWAHEAAFSNPIFPGQSDKERAMDEHNNALAKRLMDESPQATREQYEKRALEAIRSGEAQSGLTEKDLKYRASGSPKEGERSVGDRLVGYGETAASLLSGLGAGIPAGYSGLMELAKTRDSEKAAEEVGRVQKELTYEPRTKSGKKSLESAAELLENLNIPAQYVGDKAFEASGNSPLAGAAAQTLLDPLNFIPGAKGLAKLGKKGVQKAMENAAIPGDSFFAGPLGKQRGAVKPYKGTFARNSPEFLDEKENLVINKRPDVDYISNLEKYYAKARKEVEDAAGMFEGATPEQKLAMREFYDNKAMPYFEELHGTLRDPVFESLMEGRITPYGGSNSLYAFRPYAINAAKRKEAPNSGIRYPKDRDAYEDITQRYDTATGLRPSLYYPNEQNLINAANKNAPAGRFPVLTDDNGQVIPNKPLRKDQAGDAEKTRTADFIKNQMETQQEALVPMFKNQYLNPPEWYNVSVKEPGSLYSTTADNSAKAALSDMERKLSGEPATDLRQNLNPIEWAKNILAKTPEKNKQGNTVSDKMLEAMTRNEPIWDIGSNSSNTVAHGSLNFLSVEHLNDYMRTLSPERIKGMNFTQMVEESSKHQAYKAGIDKLIQDIGAGRSVDPKVFSRGMSEPIKTYEDGFRWVKANDETALKLNGTSVGHCLKGGAANCSLSGGVGGTGRKSFDSGDTEIYFLQDKRGVPVTTVEVINAKDPTKRTISQTKGNGTKTGDTAPVNYDSMVYDFAKQLNPVNISEGPRYLSPMMKELQKALKTPPPLPFKRGGAVSAARLLKDMPRTEHAY